MTPGDIISLVTVLVFASIYVQAVREAWHEFQNSDRRKPSGTSSGSSEPLNNGTSSRGVNLMPLHEGLPAENEPSAARDAALTEHEATP